MIELFACRFFSLCYDQKPTEKPDIVPTVDPQIKPETEPSFPGGYTPRPVRPTLRPIQRPTTAPSSGVGDYSTVHSGPEVVVFLSSMLSQHVLY